MGKNSCVYTPLRLQFLSSSVLMSHIPEYPKCEGVYISSSSKLEEVDLRAERVKTEEYV